MSRPQRRTDGQKRDFRSAAEAAEDEMAAEAAEDAVAADAADEAKDVMTA